MQPDVSPEVPKRYVQYGCGLSSPEGWINYDSSPTLKIQRLPLVGSVLKPFLNVTFPPAVLFGDIVAGLPESPGSVDGVYCSHVLEHLALDDLRVALKNTATIMKPGAVFRMVLPDLEWLARNYIKELESGNTAAAVSFVEGTLMGLHKRPRGLKQQMSAMFGNSHHLWMWDHESLSAELEGAGFRNIRRSKFGDAADPAFKKVEDENRFHQAVSLECTR
jgi:hypothetical protein